MASCSLIIAQSRQFATLKDISTRLKSVKNIQKITKSMKMVSAAKYARAERELKPARAYGEGASTFYTVAEIQQDAKKPNHLLVAVTSDRGLCGAVHTNIVKTIKGRVAENGTEVETRIVTIGEKSRAMLKKAYAKQMLLSFNDIGKKPPMFADASFITQAILNSGFDFEHGSMIYNRFKSVVSYKTTTDPIFALNTIKQSPKLSLYDSIDDEVLKSYNEFSLQSLLFFALKESATSEQASRMTAMDGAAKNAGEMIDKLTLTYNRTRQAVITKELIEIISGAAAV